MRSSLAAVVLLSLLAGAAFVLARATPVWWRGLRGSDPKLIAMAERVERDATEVFTMIRASDPRNDGPRYQSEAWRVSLDDAAVSAWLAARLPIWMADSRDLPPWPIEFSELQVRFEGSSIRIGVRYDGEFGEGRVFSASMRPSVRDDGTIWLNADWLYIGRLPLPADWAMRSAAKDQQEVLPDGLAGRVDAAGWFDVMCGRKPVSTTPLIKLPDGRQVRVLDLRIHAGQLHLTCRTEE